jgi:TolA-binding protein
MTAPRFHLSGTRHCKCIRSFLCSIFVIGLIIGGWSETRAQSLDKDSIKAALDSDEIGTADALLALDDQANKDPLFVNALIQAARHIGRQNHWKKSIELLQRAKTVHQSQVADRTTSSNEPAVLPHTIDLGIASAAMQLEDFELAQQHCEFVFNDLQAPASHYSAACPVLVRSLQLQGKLEAAAQTLRKACDDPRVSGCAAPLGDIALSLGAVCLEKGKPIAADQAYRSYLVLLPTGPRAADATLGAAWAAAIGAALPEQAANQLVAFVDAFPDHRDSAHALRAAATCLDQAAQAEKAEEIRKRLLQTYPSSDSAISLLPRYQQTDAPWPDSVREVWISRLDVTGKNTDVTADQLAAVFAESAKASDDTLWQAAVAWLVEFDRSGVKTETVLKQFTSDSREPLAEQLAVDLITRVDSLNKSSPAASEAACRWAGTNERWSMLALAADELGQPTEATPRSDSINRMLAESLMQTQRPAESLTWWNWLIDQGGATDFATLLRGAETAVAHGDIELATKRIEAASAASGDDDLHQSLLKLLGAELSIRRARFDEARGQLTAIVQAPGPATALRPRAQWLIGETYFMQQKYAEAIDAYRRVDSMDSAGQWAPAALLQAGKAFEKLGRGREAAVCYTALLTRFRDWPHSGIAQSRLATLQPSDAAPVLR